MDPAFRLIYIIETLLSTVPFGLLRFYAFRGELRISERVFALCYSALVLGKIGYLNFAFWPNLLPIGERQQFYLIVAVITNIFFLVIIRPFWRQLFVVGSLMVYATAIMYPFAYIIGNEWLGQGVTAHTVGCIYLLVCIGFTWNPMKRWVTDGVKPFYRYGTVMFWRFFWLIPVLFMFSVVLFGLETAGRTQINGAVVLASIIGGLGLVSGIRFMAYFMEYLYENRLLDENTALANELYRLQMESVRRDSEELSCMRHFQQEHHCWNEKFLQHAKSENWKALDEDLKDCRSELTAVSRKKEPCNDD